MLNRERDRFQAERDTLANQPVEERDAARVARLRDQGERLVQFDVRLVRLHAAYLDGVQAIPEIRNLSKAVEIEVQNVMESVLSDIPRLKRAVLQMVGLNDIRRAREGTEARRKLGNELSAIASKASSDAYLEAKRSQGDFDDELARLTLAATVLSDTVKQGAVIEAENTKKREAARRKLTEMRDTFVRTMGDAQDRLLTNG